MRSAPAWLRWVFRAPRRLYDVGWGGLLGHRFLLLRHTGRRTGRQHAVVLEVLRHDPALRRVLSMLVGGRTGAPTPTAGTRWRCSRWSRCAR
jgi:hypothetical protein